jgi:hypothetical protein
MSAFSIDILVYELALATQNRAAHRFGAALRLPWPIPFRSVGA